MSTVSSITLGGLQVVALLFPVVIATTRYMVRELQPSEDQPSARKEKLEWLQVWIVFGSLGAIILLSLTAILFVGQLMMTYNLPSALWLGFLMLLGAILTFAYPMVRVMYDQFTRDNLPTIQPPT